MLLLFLEERMPENVLYDKVYPLLLICDTLVVMFV